MKNLKKRILFATIGSVLYFVFAFLSIRFIDIVGYFLADTIFSPIVILGLGHQDSKDIVYQLILIFIVVWIIIFVLQIIITYLLKLIKNRKN